MSQEGKFQYGSRNRYHARSATAPPEFQRMPAAPPASVVSGYRYTKPESTKDRKTWSPKKPAEVPVEPKVTESELMRLNEKYAAMSSTNSNTVSLHNRNNDTITELSDSTSISSTEEEAKDDDATGDVKKQHKPKHEKDQTKKPERPKTSMPRGGLSATWAGPWAGGLREALTPRPASCMPRIGHQRARTATSRARTVTSRTKTGTPRGKTPLGTGEDLDGGGGSGGSGERDGESVTSGIESDLSAEYRVPPTYMQRTFAFTQMAYMLPKFPLPDFDTRGCLLVSPRPPPQLRNYRAKMEERMRKEIAEVKNERNKHMLWSLRSPRYTKEVKVEPIPESKKARKKRRDTEQVQGVAYNSNVDTYWEFHYGRGRQVGIGGFEITLPGYDCRIHGDGADDFHRPRQLNLGAWAEDDVCKHAIKKCSNWLRDSKRYLPSSRPYTAAARPTAAGTDTAHAETKDLKSPMRPQTAAVGKSKLSGMVRQWRMSTSVHEEEEEDAKSTGDASDMSDKHKLVKMLSRDSQRGEEEGEAKSQKVSSAEEKQPQPTLSARPQTARPKPARPTTARRRPTVGKAAKQTRPSAPRQLHDVPETPRLSGEAKKTHTIPTMVVEPPRSRPSSAVGGPGAAPGRRNRPQTARNRTQSAAQMSNGPVEPEAQVLGSLLELMA